MADFNIDRVASRGLATIIARRGIDAAAIGGALGVEAPTGPGWHGSAALALIGTGPGTWLASRDGAPPFWAQEVKTTLAGLASVSDQSQAYSVIRLGGGDARTLIQRGAAIDLHPGSFGPGSSAMTQIAHIGVLIRQLDARPTYELLIPLSYAASFDAWLDAAAAAL